MKGIRPLASSDCEEILRINAESQPGVAHLDRTELERLARLKNEHLVTEGPKGRLVGYLLAFTSDIPYDGEEFILLTKTSLGPFIYIDQVAVSAAERRTGAASRLYLATEVAAQRRGIRELRYEVNLKPPNPGSFAFHRSKGFNQTSVMETQDGRTVALMCKRLKSPEPEARET
ncbi:MAG: GNAT family N-acetyltransferase [Nitrospiraceae bacterium]